MQNYFKDSFKYLFLFMLSLSLHVSAASPDLSSLTPVRLSNHVLDIPAGKADFLGRLETSVPVPVTFVLPLRNQEALADLINRLYDPADKEFGKYLTPEEFNERFAPSQADYDKVIAYAKSAGLEVTQTHSNRTLLNASAHHQLIEQTFNLQLDQYQTSSGRKFYAPNNNPEVPASIASIISGIVGLDNHAVWRPFHVLKEVVQESHLNLTANAFPSGPGGGMAPADITTAYNLGGVAAKGTGQIVALFQLGQYQTSDIDTYSKQFGLPAAKLTNVLVDGGASAGVNAEVTLDIELVHALAPESQIYVYEGPNSGQGVLDTYNRIATDNIAKQVSTSWGLGESFNLKTQQLQAENAIFQQMAVHGQTIFAASGDSGAFDDYPNTGSQSPAVDDPASQPYVVGVGGTHLTVNSQNGTYVAETVWNDGLGNGAGGGGVSAVWPIPAWQTNVPTTYSKTNRNVPDVSLNADGNTGYAIFVGGQWTIYGGTSCAAPLWAGFTARVNQGLAANNKPVLGFANPALYAIGNGPSYAANFFDITSGDNLFYHAAKGYDNATGWGSFNGANLYATLTNSIPIPTPPPSQSPVLDISIVHTPNPFVKGSVGIYTINVMNKGNASTSGPITVTISLPAGIKPNRLTGLGWTINASTLTCTQNFPIKAGFSYPPIILGVKVGRRAQSPVITTATISGGGSVSSTATDQTTVR